jgi:hypothetical protein
VELKSILAWLIREQSSELQQIFDSAPPDPSDHVLATPHIKSAYMRATGGSSQTELAVDETEATQPAGQGRRLEAIGEDCPVCVHKPIYSTQSRTILDADSIAATRR